MYSTSLRQYLHLENQDRLQMHQNTKQVKISDEGERGLSEKLQEWE